MKKENGITLIAMLVVFIVLVILIGVVLNLLFGNDGMVNDIKNYAHNVLNIETENKQVENHYIYENTINTIDTNMLNNQTNTLNESTNVQSSSWYN